MNEVMVEFGNGGYVYYDTDENNALWAAEEVLKCMENNGINVDNLYPTRAVLRDQNRNDISETDFH